MSAESAAPVRPGDSIVYLLDRATVSEAVLATIRNPVLVGMATQWLREYPHRFFLTIARNYQPIPGTTLHTFDSHDDSVLFLDEAALMGAMPRMASATGPLLWVVLGTEDVRRAVTAALA